MLCYGWPTARWPAHESHEIGDTSSRRVVEGADGRGHGQTPFLAEDFNRSISLLSAICQSHSRRITRKEGAGRHQSPRKRGEDERAEEGGGRVRLLWGES